MPKSTYAQNSFVGGEISPLGEGRFDYQKYYSCCKSLENYLIYPLGGAQFRPGTIFTAETKDSTKASRIIPFQYSNDQPYIIEVGDYYMRFYFGGGQVVHTVSDVSAWGTGTGYVVGDFVKVGTTIYYCIVAHTSGTFATDLSAGKWLEQSILEIPTPYPVADIFDLHFVQSADTMYIVHNNYAPRKLQRTTATSFVLTTVSFVRGPFMDSNITTTTITPSAATGTGITLTASTAIFAAGHIGSLWRVKDAVVKITAFTTDKILVGDVQAEPTGTAGNIGGTSAYTDWSEGAFSTYRGFPAAVAFHKQRLVYANTVTEPQRYWASTLGAYDNFQIHTTVVDDDSIVYTLAADERNAIIWLKTSPTDLLAGTTGGTWSINIDTPTTPKASQDTVYGSASKMPKRVSTNLFYLSKSGMQGRELVFDLYYNSQKSENVTKIADHILRDGTGAVDMAYQQSPTDRIWVVRADGQIAVMTRNVEEQIIGWSRVVAGVDSSGANGFFESIASIQHVDTDDDVYVVVKRKINGIEKRFIEYFSGEYFDEPYDALRLDCGLSYNTPKYITNISGDYFSIAWAKRHEATLDYSLIDDNLTYFTVPLLLSATSGINATDLTDIFTTLGNNYKKISVRTAAGVELYVQVKEWNSGTQKAVLYVSGPSFVISKTADTVLYLYYDATQPDNSTMVSLYTDGVASPGVKAWDPSRFYAVYPLGENGVTAYDALGVHNGIIANAGRSIAGLLGKAHAVWKYPAENAPVGIIDLGTAFWPGGTPFIEALFYVNHADGPTWRDRIAGRWDGGNPGFLFSCYLNAGVNAAHGSWFEMTQPTAKSKTTTNPTVFEWNYGCGGYSGTQVTSKFIGTTSDSAAAAITGTLNQYAGLHTVIGATDLLGFEALNGYIQDVRFYKAPPSAAWQKANGYAMRDKLIRWVALQDRTIKITSPSHGISEGAEIYINKIVGMTELNNQKYLAYAVNANYFNLKTLAGDIVYNTNFHSYISGGQIRATLAVVTGLDHLENETVQVTVDGFEPAGVTNAFVVRGGQVTLPVSAAVVQAGLPYHANSLIRLLKQNDGDPSGVGQPKTRAISRMTLRVYRSLGGTIGQDVDNMIPLYYKGINNALTTDDLEQHPQTWWAKGPEVCIKQNAPLPLFILAVIIKSTVGDM